MPVVFYEGQVLFRPDIAPGIAMHLACCCGAIGCPDCLEGLWPNTTGYKWRVKTGTWENCPGLCADQVWDGIVAAGGGPAGAGISMDNNSPTGYCDWKTPNLQGCNCGVNTTTPVDADLMIDTDFTTVINGVCCYRAIFDFQGSTFETDCFNPCATSGDPNVFTLQTDGLCCDNPTEIEIWAIDPCDRPVP